MARVRFHPAIQSIRGRVGDVIFQAWKGVFYIRAYTPPRPTRTPAQVRRRDAFASQVRAWKNLDARERLEWDRRGKDQGRSGYHLFLSTGLRALRPEGHTPQVRAHGAMTRESRMHGAPRRPRMGYALDSLHLRFSVASAPKGPPARPVSSYNRPPSPRPAPRPP
ncbi:MAG: hypothetical protein J0L75_21005 [Spirochaetes bacterium]|nr:hypothetical protein [Spirochaetota bacterium]